MTNKFKQLSGGIIELEVPVPEQMTADTMIYGLGRKSADWQSMAVQYADGMSYYMGLLDQIAGYIGPEAFKADDGTVHDSPIRARIPELVAGLVRR